MQMVNGSHGRQHRPILPSDDSHRAIRIDRPCRPPGCAAALGRRGHPRGRRPVLPSGFSRRNLPSPGAGGSAGQAQPLGRQPLSLSWRRSAETPSSLLRRTGCALRRSGREAAGGRRRKAVPPPPFFPLPSAIPHACSPRGGAGAAASPAEGPFGSCLCAMRTSRPLRVLFRAKHVRLRPADMQVRLRPARRWRGFRGAEYRCGEHFFQHR